MNKFTLVRGPEQGPRKVPLPWNRLLRLSKLEKTLLVASRVRYLRVSNWALRERQWQGRRVKEVWKVPTDPLPLVLFCRWVLPQQWRQPPKVNRALPLRGKVAVVK